MSFIEVRWTRVGLQIHSFVKAASSVLPLISHQHLIRRLLPLPSYFIALELKLALGRKEALRRILPSTLPFLVVRQILDLLAFLPQRIEALELLLV